jgi:predicted metal-dependent HD superfamily phosphohydrolase
VTDLERWRAMWAAFGADEAYQLELFDELQRCYAEPGRAYHTLAHIRDCLRQFDLVRPLAGHPHRVECALWFHDVIYDPGRSDSEERSARWAVRALRQAGAPDPVPARVEALILATKHHAPPASPDPDAALVVDIDLAILGRPPAEFDAYEAAIRREYAALPEEDYRRGRAEFVRDLLARPRIYQTDYFFERYEAQARRNLVRSLERLEAAM